MVLVRFALVAVACVLVGCADAPADSVLVLHTSDTYGYFEDCGCAADVTGGLAKRAWVVDSLREHADSSILLVDAGDFTGGDNAYGAALGRVMMEAMGIMEYDAFTLGEWDLDHGPAYVREIVEANPAAWIHTNYDVAGLEDLGQRSMVFERGGRRVGVIGLLNPTILLNPAVRDSVEVRDIVGSARTEVARLRAGGVDAVVALSHLSHQGSRALAERVDGIDLVVTGHGGTTLDAAEPVVPGTWLVGSGDLGRYLGVAELELDARGEETAVVEVDGRLVTLDPTIPDDPRLRPLFERYEEERAALLEREIDARRSGRYFRDPDVDPEGGGLEDLSEPR